MMSVIWIIAPSRHLMITLHHKHFVTCSVHHNILLWPPSRFVGIMYQLRAGIKILILLQFNKGSGLTILWNNKKGLADKS